MNLFSLFIGFFSFFILKPALNRTRRRVSEYLFLRREILKFAQNDGAQSLIIVFIYAFNYFCLPNTDIFPEIMVRNYKVYLCLLRDLPRNNVAEFT